MPHRTVAWCPCFKAACSFAEILQQWLSTNGLQVNDVSHCFVMVQSVSKCIVNIAWWWAIAVLIFECWSILVADSSCFWVLMTLKDASWLMTTTQGCTWQMVLNHAWWQLMFFECCYLMFHEGFAIMFHDVGLWWLVIFQNVVIDGEWWFLLKMLNNVFDDQKRSHYFSSLLTVGTGRWLFMLIDRCERWFIVVIHMRWLPIIADDAYWALPILSDFQWWLMVAC